MRFGLNTAAGSLAMAGFLVVAAQGQSHGASDTLTVVAEVAGSCSLEGGTLNFGTYLAGQPDPLEARATITYNCPEDLEIRIELGAGQQPQDGARAMAHESSGAESLKYELYQDASRSVVWGGPDYGGQALSISGTRTSEQITVFGTVLPNQNSGYGNYRDVVRVDLIVE